VRIEVRPATPDDLGAVHAIYSHHVLKGLASFEEVPPSRDEIARRYRDLTASGLPTEWTAGTKKPSSPILSSAA